MGIRIGLFAAGLALAVFSQDFDCGALAAPVFGDDPASLIERLIVASEGFHGTYYGKSQGRSLP
jgi:hypothetical protein